MTRILLAVNDPRLADHIAGLVAESDELEITSSVREPQELRSVLPRHDVDAVVLHDRRGSVPLIEVTRELTVTQPDLGIVLVVAEGSAELLRSGMQAGARDVISEPIGLEQLETSVLAAVAWTHALRQRAARDAGGELLGVGRVVTVVGAKGGVGTTTVAVHLALAARELGTPSVCLVEYDLQAGDLRAFLDFPYRRSVVDLAAVAEELTTRHLQESLYTHPSGVRVLLGPQEGEHAEGVTAAAARNILTAIRTREDLTIVDAGSMLTDASAIAAEMADTALVVTTPDVISLRGAVRLCALWERLKIEPPEIAVLLNRSSRKLEVQPELARRVVPAPLLQTTVPADFFSLESAVNTGIPTSDAASDAMLRPMAAVLGEISALPPKEAEESRSDRRRSIAARFAGEGGQATVEFAGSIPIMLVVLIAIWQIVLVGMTFVFAGDGARAGARALAVGQGVATAAKSNLPGGWQDNATVSQQTDNSGDGTVHVNLQVPFLVPGLFNVPAITVPSSARTVIEDQMLAGESGGFSMVFGGGPAGAVKPIVLPLPSPAGHPGTILPSGDATAPADVPPTVRLMIAAANSIDQMPYPSPDAHYGSLAVPWPAYDCSGSVSYVLYKAGLIGDTSYVSSDFYNYASLPGGTAKWQPGPGKWVTIWAKPGQGENGHVHIVIAGLNFDTNHGPPSGPRWFDSSQLGDSGPPYIPMHPVGL